MNRLDKLNELLECADQDQWSATLFTLSTECGFAHTLFGAVPSKTVPLASAFLKSNYPEAWRSDYIHREMHNVDPVVTHCLGSAMPIFWKPGVFPEPRHNEFFEQAGSHGLRSGISFPVHGPSGEFGIMSFASDDVQHVAQCQNFNALAQLSLIRDYAFESSLKFSDNVAPEPDSIGLTKRELECLKWIAIGKSSWEISNILQCSESGINFHVANLKRKFKVNSRQQAVIRAIKLRIVSPT